MGGVFYFHNMIKQVLSLLLLLLVTIAGAQSFTVQIKITNYKTGKKEAIQLLKYYGDNFSTIDSAAINSDTTIAFVLNNVTDGLYAVKCRSEKENKAEFIINKNEKELKLEAAHFQLLNGEIAIDNSTENTAYAKLLEVRGQYSQPYYVAQAKLDALSIFSPAYKTQQKAAEEAIEQLDKEVNKAMDAITVAYPATYTAQVLVPLAKTPVRADNPGWQVYYDGYRSLLHAHFFHYVNTTDSRLLTHYAFNDKLREYLQAYNEKTTDGTKQGIDIIMGSLKDNDEVNSYVYNTLLKTFIKYKSDVLIKHLTDKHPNGCALDLSAEELQKLTTMQATAVGGKAPDILLYDDKGKVQSLYEQCKKNKYTILVFWISWCNRCQKETPELEKLYQQYKKQGLGLFAVSVDEKKEEWLKGLTENKMSGVNVSELIPLKQSKVLPLYGVSNTPALFILDKDGKIIAKNVFGDKLHSEIAALFK